MKVDLGTTGIYSTKNNSPKKPAFRKYVGYVLTDLGSKMGYRATKSFTQSSFPPAPVPPIRTGCKIKPWDSSWANKNVERKPVNNVDNQVMYGVFLYV